MLYTKGARATEHVNALLLDDRPPRQWRCGRPALANLRALLHIPAGGRGCSSGVEHHVANVRVVGSNPIARSNFIVSDPCRPPNFGWPLKKPHGGRRRSRPTAPPKGKPRGSPRPKPPPRASVPMGWPAGQWPNRGSNRAREGRRPGGPPPNVYRSRVFAHGLNYPRAEVEIYPRAELPFASGNEPIVAMGAFWPWACRWQRPRPWGSPPSRPAASPILHPAKGRRTAFGVAAARGVHPLLSPGRQTLAASPTSPACSPAPQCRHWHTRPRPLIFVF
jgi:hypothetical protein